MPTYAIRSVIRLKPQPDQSGKYLYEERITIWNSSSLEAGFEEAEKDAHAYASEISGAEALDLFQGFWLFKEVATISQGTEVFSLVRESDLEPTEYIDTFFDTGAERQRYQGAG